MSTWDNDKRIDKMRSGDANDPYVYLQEPHKIVNQKVVLEEYPDDFNKVVIDNFTEVLTTTPLASQFYCDYANSMLFFNSADDGKTITAKYYGKGVVLLPISRIWVQETNGDVTQTLEEMIDNYNLHTEDERIANEAIRVSNENTRIISENTRISQEIARVNAEAVRVTGGALIKSGDTMTGDLHISTGKGIVFDNIKIAKNSSLGTLDITTI
ncbi:MAG: hypothetical protein LLF98_02010 [Clostridium sp.]|uniref:hypothetical protein n=1 Tax=Clostridium sp. TaxID=1506 RepID=UPI0025B7EB19|nr:hypothetical protein [Clostridium sp.]MCE5220056.1 hypothetical protein [Clostridium sp.]